MRSRRLTAAGTPDSAWPPLRFPRVVLFLIALASFPDLAHAGRVTLAWDPSPDAVAGYTVYYGTQPNAASTFTHSVDTTQTTITIQGLPNGVRHYFVVKAFSTGRVYSAASNEVDGIPSNQAPTITNPGTRTTSTGAFSLTVAAADADGDTLAYSATGLPAGLSIDSATGQISGTVLATGSFAVTVTVSDGAAQATAAFTLNVTPVSTGFTDDPLVPGEHTMQVFHISELRGRIDALRKQRQLAPVIWTPLVANSTLIRATHITEMRTALDGVYNALKRALPVYTDPTLSAGVSIKAAHVMELRAAVRVVE